MRSLLDLGPRQARYSTGTVTTITDEAFINYPNVLKLGQKTKPQEKSRFLLSSSCFHKLLIGSYFYHTANFKPRSINGLMELTISLLDIKPRNFLMHRSRFFSSKTYPLCSLRLSPGSICIVATVAHIL